MSEYEYLKQSLLSLIVITTLSVCLVPAVPALGWGAVVGTSEVHQLILNTAYDFLRRDPAFDSTGFPGISNIVQNEGVTDKIARTGPGPDADNSNSPWSEHWYNADAPGFKGATPDSVAREFLELALSNISRRSGHGEDNRDPARAAAWGAHFLADIEIPFHTNGASFDSIIQIYNQQGGANAPAVFLNEDIVGSLDFCYGCLFTPDWDFKPEIEAFLKETQSNPLADWFDPWYFNGETDLTSSHVLYEGFKGNVIEIPPVSSYSPDWQNTNPTFISPVTAQAQQAADFTRLAAENSRANQLVGLENPEVCVALAAQRVATMWRASFSALDSWLDIRTPDKFEPDKLTVVGKVKNHGNGKATDVEAKLYIEGGVVSGLNIKDVSDVGPGGTSKEVTWEIEVTDPNGAVMIMETIYSYSQPDLQFARTGYTTGRMDVKTTTSTTPRTGSAVILLNGSAQMGKIGHEEGIPMVLRAIESLPDNVFEIAVYAYGEQCDVWGFDFSPVPEMIEIMKGYLDVPAQTKGNAPLAKAITKAGTVLRNNAKGEALSIVLITNSAKDTCGGDPIEAAKNLGNINLQSRNPFVKTALAANNNPISLHVVGVRVDSTIEEQGLRDLATAGKGQYFSVDNIDQMAGAIQGAFGSSQSGPGSFFGNIQPWWFAAGAAILLFIIVMIAGARKRRAQPATTPAMPCASSTPPVSVPPPLVNTVTAWPVAEKKALFCPKCGTESYRDAAFCVNCGSPLALAAPVSAVAEPAPVAAVFCPRCGTSNAAGSVFCNKCGTAIRTGMVEATPAAARTAGKKVAFGWWLLPIFFALIGGMIAWSALKREHPKTARNILWLGITVSVLVFWAIVNNYNF